MARCAAAALLGAIEIYNKPTVQFREQTFAMLTSNAWEILLKSRIIQQHGGRIHAIYRRKRGSRLIDRDLESNEPRTISLRQALQRVSIPGEVAANIKGMMHIRNHAAHLGPLDPASQLKVLQFGTASVQNFTKITLDWFGETIDAPYLLPLGFIGDATLVSTSTSRGQRLFLHALDSISNWSGGTAASEYSVVLHVQVAINRGFSGGGSIGRTNDPSAPKLNITDDEALSYYSTAYSDLVSKCRNRYPGFKQNSEFNSAMRNIQADTDCSHERRLDPQKPNSPKKWFYNLENSLQQLDAWYGYRPNP